MDQFVYPWNTDGEKMADYFSKLKINKPVDVQVMNELNIMKEVWSEPDGTKIIILLTSSKTYSFGLAQWKFFRILLIIFNTLLNSPLNFIDFDSRSVNQALFRKCSLTKVTTTYLIMYLYIYIALVKDVFTVGHCMYGCDSCSVSEHRFPLFFSRYIKNTLPFNGEYVKK